MLCSSVLLEDADIFQRFEFMLLARIEALERENTRMRAHLQELKQLYPVTGRKINVRCPASALFQFVAFQDVWLSRREHEREAALAAAISASVPQEVYRLQIMHCQSPITAAEEDLIRSGLSRQDNEALYDTEQLNKLFTRQMLIVEGVVSWNDAYLSETHVANGIDKAWGAAFVPDEATQFFDSRGLQNETCCLEAFQRACGRKAVVQSVIEAQPWYEMVTYARRDTHCYTIQQGKPAEMRQEYDIIQLSSSYRSETLSLYARKVMPVTQLGCSITFKHPRIIEVLKLYGL